MSEEILIQKKKKKILSIEEAVEILKPFVTNWKRQDEEMANKMYEVYKRCQWGDWSKILDALAFPSSTWSNWVEHFGFELKYPQMGHDNTTDSELSQSELEPAIVEDEQETEYDTIKYQETYSIIDRFEKLTKNMFKVVEKEELIKKHETALKKQTGLHVMLESE